MLKDYYESNLPSFNVAMKKKTTNALQKNLLKTHYYYTIFTSDMVDYGIVWRVKSRS